MPPVKKKLTVKKAKKLAGPQLKQPPELPKNVSNGELKEAISDLIYEMQNLNSNLGKLWGKLSEMGIEREIPDDDVPF